MTEPTRLANRPYAERRSLAADLRVAAPTVARAVTEDFLRKHPDWLERFGLAAVERGVEDARFHIEFLAAAIETGDAPAFADYLQWTSRVLSARNIAPHFLLENIEQVRAALAGRLRPEQQSVIDDVVRSAVAEFKSDAAADEPELNASVQVYLSAALSGQRGAALNVAHEMMREGASVIDIYDSLLQTAQHEIGRLWETNRITVAQEHLATTVTQYVIAQLYGGAPRAARGRGNVVVCGVEGEYHQIGAQLVAEALDKEGYNVRFLGSHLPNRDIVRFVRDHNAHALAISVTMLFNLPKAADLIEDVRRAHEGRLQIIVGGRAFRTAPALCTEIGADACASDVRDALDLFDRLVA